MMLTLETCTSDVQRKSVQFALEWQYDEIGPLLFETVDATDGHAYEFWALSDMTPQVVAWAKVKLSDLQFMKEHRSEVQIVHLQVRKEFRRMGFGTMVVEAAKARAKSENIAALVLNTRRDEDNMRFYTRNGLSVARDSPWLVHETGRYVWLKWTNQDFVPPTIAERVEKFRRLVNLPFCEVVDVEECVAAFRAHHESSASEYATSRAF